LFINEDLEEYKEIIKYESQAPDFAGPGAWLNAN